MKMSSKQDISAQVLFASGAGYDALGTSWQSAKDLVRSLDLDMDEIRIVRFGVKKWQFIRGSHRAVIIDLPVVKNKLKLAFRLDLEIDLGLSGQHYITGNFTCPKVDCTYETDSFRKYTSHYYFHYCKGDHLTHKCCGGDIDDFPTYCKHTYEKHKNIKKISLRFQRICPDKINEFLDETSVTYFPSGMKQASFRDLILSALSILNNFGTYFIFLWNCQDFATWYLNYNGVPLHEIDPTMPDIFTGSGIDSSVRSVQQIKGWLWYKNKENLRTIQLDEYGGEAMCNHPNCKYLPAMTIDDLVIHKRMAHELVHNKVVEFCVKVVGSPFNISDVLSSEPRKFSIYRLRGNKLNSHEAVVVQSWTLGENTQQTENFCKIHIVELANNQFAQLKLDSLNDKDKERIEHVMNVTITLTRLQLVIVAMEISVRKISYVTLNCVTFAEQLIDQIRGNSTSATSVSVMSWSVWMTLALISCSKLYDCTATLLPLIILVSRTFDQLNLLISLFLCFHIGIHTLCSDYSMQDAILDIARSLKHLEIPEIKPLLFLPCYIGLVGLGLQGIMDPVNIAAPLILYSSWGILNNIISLFFIRLEIEEHFLWHVDTVWSSVQYLMYYNVCLYLIKFAMMVSLTLDYIDYIIGQLIAIAVASMPLVVLTEYNAVTSKRIIEQEYTLSYQYGDLVRFEGLSSTLIQKMIFLLYIIITLSGLFYGKERCHFDNYNFLYTLPYLCFFTWKLYIVNKNVTTRVLETCRIGELVPLVTLILKKKNFNMILNLRNTFNYLALVKLALKILLAISKLYAILPAVWVVILVTNPTIQRLHIWMAIFVNFYCCASTCFVHIAFNAAHHLYISMNSRFLIKQWFKGGEDEKKLWKYVTGEDEVTLVPFL